MKTTHEFSKEELESILKKHIVNSNSNVIKDLNVSQEGNIWKADYTTTIEKKTLTDAAKEKVSSVFSMFKH